MKIISGCLRTIENVIKTMLKLVASGWYLISAVMLALADFTCRLTTEKHVEVSFAKVWLQLRSNICHVLKIWKK